jgi:peroxiredoxin
MKRTIIVLLICFAVFKTSIAQLQPGEKAPGISLPDESGKMVSLTNYFEDKGIVLIFSNNHCPFAQAYQERIIKLHNDYAKYGYPVLMINIDGESASNSAYPFTTLLDSEHRSLTSYQVERCPTAFVLQNKNKSFQIVYSGAIDNNPVDAELVTVQYIDNALRAIETGETPSPETVKPVGCSITKTAQ